MKVGASMTALSPSIRVPPNHSTIAISIEPSSSLTGCALDWRMATRLFFILICSVMPSKRELIFFSARKALIILSPPRVSSTWLMVSLQYCWASSDWALSRLPTALMMPTIMGANTSVKRVSCQDMMNRTVM